MNDAPPPGSDLSTGDSRAPFDGPIVRLLLVEDNFLVAQAIVGLLEDTGFTVRCAESGEDAWELITQGRADYDIVVCDLTMPGLPGRDLLKRLVAAHPDLPVLIITGMSHPDLEREMRGLGAAGVVPKPIDFGSFVGVLRNVYASIKRS